MKTAAAAAEPPEPDPGRAAPHVTVIYPGGPDRPTTSNLGVYAHVMVTVEHLRAGRGVAA